MLIRKHNLDDFQDCEGYKLRWLYPWDDVVRTPFGSAWTHLAPGQYTKKHQHHELETYFVAFGHGEMGVDDEAVEVGPGDVIYMPPFYQHVLRNTSDREGLLFLSVFWEDMDALSTDKEEGREATDAPPRAVRVVSSGAPGSAPQRAAEAHRRYLEQRGMAVRTAGAANGEVAGLVERLADGGHLERRAGGRLVLALGEHAEALRRDQLAARLDPPTRAECERRLAAGLGEVTLVGNGDVEPGVERVLGLLADREAGEADVFFIEPEDIADVALLYPALRLAADPEAAPATVIVQDEADAAESAPTASELERWDAWLGELGERLHGEYGGKVPATGLWTEEQRHFYEQLKGFVTAAERAYEASTFSLPDAVQMLSSLVETTRRFARRELHWRGVPDRGDERRTSIALELAAARLLAMLAAPILPELSERLAKMLGEAATPGWEAIPRWVDAGRQLSLQLGRMQAGVR